LALAINGPMDGMLRNHLGSGFWVIKEALVKKRGLLYYFAFD
jgi:hypothetical protein